MKPRRWWACPRLTQWRYMVECGDYEGSFAAFPASDPGASLYLTLVSVVTR